MWDTKSPLEFWENAPCKQGSQGNSGTRLPPGCSGFSTLPALRKMSTELLFGNPFHMEIKKGIESPGISFQWFLNLPWSDWNSCRNAQKFQMFYCWECASPIVQREPGNGTANLMLNFWAGGHWGHWSKASTVPWSFFLKKNVSFLSTFVNMVFFNTLKLYTSGTSFVRVADYSFPT